MFPQQGYVASSKSNWENRIWPDWSTLFIELKLLFIFHMPKQPLSCILKKWKFPGQKFLGSLRAEEQRREWKNNMSSPMEILIFLPISHRNAKNRKMVWKDVRCKVLKVGKASESDKILFLLTFLSRISCTPFPKRAVFGSKWHVLLFLH